MSIKLTTPLPGLKAHMEGRKTGYVADKLGMDQSYFSQVVNCKRGVTLATALKIAAYFNTTVEELAEQRQSVTA